MKTFILLFLFISHNAHSFNYKENNKNIQKELRNKIHNNIKNKNNKPLTKVKIAIIDTGADLNNPMLSSRISASSNIDKIQDNIGHGTHVQGIIQLLLEDNDSIEITPLNYKITYNQTYFEDIDNYLGSLKEAIDNNVDIINYSGGGPNFIQEEYDLLKLANEKGIIVVVASGNESSHISSNPFYPASIKLNNIISVSNYLDVNNLNYSTNFGKGITLGAKGTMIPSLCPNHSLRPCYMSGTSMAAPVVTSAIIKLKQRYPYLTINQIKHILEINSHKDSYTDYGFFDYVSFHLWLNNNYDKDDFYPKKEIVKNLVEFPIKESDFSYKHFFTKAPKKAP